MPALELRFNGVSERDMDMLFLEEFVVNRSFLDLFLKKIGNEGFSDYEIVSAETSFVDPVLGESDLTIILEKNQHRIGLLIEDKINAVAQPRQYERYVERGNKGIQEKRYDAFYVFLVAPVSYCGNESADKYPLRVTYEDCLKLFEMQTDIRSRLKFQQISEAIELGHKPYNKVVNEISTAFWGQYVRHMYTNYPDIDLKSKIKEKSRNGDWPTYRTCLDMKNVYIHHKMKMKDVDYSFIDLTFNRLADHREKLKQLLQEMLGEYYNSSGFGVHRAGKSAVLRLVAPRSLDWQVPFEDQIDIVDEHLRLVSKLCEAASRIDKKRLMEFYAKTIGTVSK